jgi:hypothetical protein
MQDKIWKKPQKYLALKGCKAVDPDTDPVWSVSVIIKIRIRNGTVAIEHMYTVLDIFETSTLPHKQIMNQIYISKPIRLIKQVLRIRNRKDPKLLAGSGSDPEPK